MQGFDFTANKERGCSIQNKSICNCTSLASKNILENFCVKRRIASFKIWQCAARNAKIQWIKEHFFNLSWSDIKNISGSKWAYFVQPL